MVVVVPSSWMIGMTDPASSGLAAKNLAAEEGDAETFVSAWSTGGSNGMMFEV